MRFALLPLTNLSSVWLVYAMHYLSYGGGAAASPRNLFGNIQFTSAKVGNPTAECNGISSDYV
jgi:hypothetical protein